jgi:hypothetical protein
LAVVLVIPSAGDTAGVKVTDRAFSTPQEALNYYIEGVRSCDLDKMSQAFGIAKTSEKFNFTAFTNRLKVIMPATSLMPSDYDKFVSLNEVFRLNQCTTMYKEILYSFNDIDWQRTIIPDGGMDETYIKEYIKKINPATLKNIKVSQFRDFPMASEKVHLENMQKSAVALGADEHRVYEVELECNGIKVNCELLSVFRYGSSWYINNGIFKTGALNN